MIENEDRISERSPVTPQCSLEMVERVKKGSSHHSNRALSPSAICASC